MKSIRHWFDTSADQAEFFADGKTKVDWLRVIPFIGIHLGCLLAFSVGVSPLAIFICVFLYLLRMFAITGFYHRYFSHKSFKTSRVLQFIFAVIGAASTQRGPLWWAAHHRTHHRHSDQKKDPHTPNKGFLWSHMGWFLSRENYVADYKRVTDLQKYKELVWLDRYDTAVPFFLALGLLILGNRLNAYYPSLGTSGWQLVVWGYFISTVVLIHATLCINSLAHKVGKRRYATQDQSRNNGFLALVTLGEGWHNNHHYFPASARQGFYWWEVDITFYILKIFSWLGLIWDVRTVPIEKRDNHAGAPYYEDSFANKEIKQ